MKAVIGSHSCIHAIKGETRLFFTPGNKGTHMYQFYDLAIDCGKGRWVEKTPEHLHRIKEILKSWEMAKVIIMIRDGRDVVASLFARTSKLRENVSRWKNDTKTTVSFANHPRVLLVKYEDLVAEFKETTMRVFAFIGEEYEDAVRKFYKHQDVVDKPLVARSRGEILRLRAWQVSQPLFDGRGRHKELDEKQYDYVYRRQKGMLSELGYIE